MLRICGLCANNFDKTKIWRYYEDEKGDGYHVVRVFLFKF